MYLICTVPLGTLKSAFKIKCIIFIVIVMFDVHVVCSFRYEYNTCMGMGGLQRTFFLLLPSGQLIGLGREDVVWLRCVRYGVACGNMLPVVAAWSTYGDTSEYFWWMAVFALDVRGFRVSVTNVGVRLY